MLDLYVQKGCPFCAKVIDFLDKSNIKCNIKDISDPDNYKMLIKLGGKNQVPFLDDKYFNTSMYESDIIVDYLNARY